MYNIPEANLSPLFRFISSTGTVDDCVLKIVKRVEALVEVNMPGPMSYRSVYKTYQHLLTQEAENNTDQFLRGEHDLLEYQKVGSGVV